VPRSVTIFVLIFCTIITLTCEVSCGNYCKWPYYMQRGAFFYKAVASSWLDCFVSSCETATKAHSRKSHVITQLHLVPFKIPKICRAGTTQLCQGRKFYTNIYWCTFCLLQTFIWINTFRWNRNINVRIWKILLQYTKWFELVKNFPENWNFVMTTCISRFYEAHSTLIRSITIHFIFTINILYNAAGVVHDVVQCFASLLSKGAEL
jgi:hypothetical protein